MVDRSLDWLENRGEGRFFLLVHDYDVHSSYGALPRYHDLLVRPYEGFVDGSAAQLRSVRKGEMSLGPDDLRHLIDLYVAGIRQLDDEFGRLIQGLKDLGVYRDTLVVVVSDHGEEFLEHGGVLHGRTQYEEMLRIPMIMRGPGLPAGLRVRSPVSLVDVFPTALSLLGLPGTDELDGMDLGPSLRSGEQPPPERLLFGEADHNNSEDDITRSVRQGRFKLHYNRLDQSMQLYDLESDPGENRDLRRELPEVAERLMGELRAFTAKSVEGQAIEELSTTELEQLRELGYLEDFATGDGDVGATRACGARDAGYPALRPARIGRWHRASHAPVGREGKAGTPLHALLRALGRDSALSRQHADGPAALGARCHAQWHAVAGAAYPTS